MIKISIFKRKFDHSFLVSEVLIVLLSLVCRVCFAILRVLLLLVVTCLCAGWMLLSCPVAVRVILVLKHLEILASHSEFLNLRLSLLIKVNNFFVF